MAPGNEDDQTDAAGEPSARDPFSGYASGEVDPEDRWGDTEPPEFRPEDRWGDPERDLPQIPTVDGATDLDPEHRKYFWVSVFYANLAIAGLAIGPMLIYFRSQWIAGLVAIALGAVGLIRTYQYSRGFPPDSSGEHNG